MALMGYEKNLELYLNLSRKELQGLCKKNNLPANRSHTQLAKSLAFFSKKNAKSSPSREKPREKSCSPFEVPLCKSYGPSAESGGIAIYSEGMIRGAFGKRTSGVKQKRVDDRRHSETRDQTETNGQMDCHISKNAYSNATIAVCPRTNDNETRNRFGCSIVKARDVGLRSSSAADVQHITTVPQLGSECHDGGSKNKSSESPVLKKCGQTLLNHAATSSGTCNLSNIQPNAVGRSTETGAVLSEDFSSKKIPSFQFFVMSEEGINLFVDLNSRPAEWISSLKDEVCINPKTQPLMSNIIPNHGSFSNVDEHKIIASETIGIQDSGVERNSGCTDSSVASVVSEICQSEAYFPDATIVSSGSSVLTSNNNPVEISGSLDKNQVASSNCISQSNSRNSKSFDIASVPGQWNALHQDSTNDFFRIEKGSCPDEVINAEQMDCESQKMVDAENNNLLKSDGIGNDVAALDIDYFGIHTAAYQASTETRPMEGLLEVNDYVNRSIGSSQVVGQLAFDCPATEVQLDSRSADHLCNQNSCSSGNTVPHDPVPESNNGLGKSIVMEKENSDSHSKISKRSNTIEFDGELQSKRHHSSVANEIMVNLRSTRTSAKITVSNQVVRPRRSTRLLPK